MIRLSATIRRGAVTNRVRVAKQPQRSPGTRRKAYRADPEVRGLDTTTVCISLPIGELESMDATCERVQMARSHFLRQAAKHFTQFVLGGRK